MIRLQCIPRRIVNSAFAMFSYFCFIQLLFINVLVDGCSNIIVNSHASKDGSSIVAYNADSATLYGSLYHYPAADHPPGSMRQIYDWDSGRYLGEIEEASHTYNVVGNMNEFGVVIGETTFGGIGALSSQAAAKVDYGSLIWVTLQRSTTARDAIKTIDYLMQTYGYASSGESFSIADQKETWVMEIIGKGNYELGAVWVAMKLPDGAVCAHANQARIQTFPLNDNKNCLHAADTISFAKKIGLYPTDASDESFSFSDVYDPVSFSGARFCEARVWSFFSSVMGQEWSDQYFDYAQGTNLTNRMPLFVMPKADVKISVADTMKYMRSHYEESKLDMSSGQFEDVGSAYSHSPHRIPPLTWQTTLNSHTYVNERPIATQQTGWNFVAQTRKWMPRELCGILWFSVDDSSTTVRFPIYGSATQIPDRFAGKGAQDGVTPPMMSFNFQSAFYVFNLVANFAYHRWDLIYPEIVAQIDRFETIVFDDIATLDKQALALYKIEGAEKAVQFVTEFSVTAGNTLVQEWGNFFGQLFVKYRDGYVITPNANQASCGCSTASQSYPETWYERIVNETGDHYQIPEESLRVKPSSFSPMSKTELLQRR